MSINLLLLDCPFKRKPLTARHACNMKHVIKQPTRVATNSNGVTSSTLIDHIYTNTVNSVQKQDWYLEVSLTTIS